MSRQVGVLAGIGAVVVAVVGGALFLVLQEPDAAPPDRADDGAAAATASPTDVAQEPDAGATRRRARVPGGATLLGIVRHAADDTPAAAQTVRLVGAGVGTIDVATDSSGAFRFEALPPGGPYAVEVDAEGYAPVRLPGIALDRSEERDLGTLLLDLAVRVEVRVNDLAGDALPGARVSAYAAPEFGWGFDWSKAMAQMGQEPVAVASADTGAAGAAVFDDLAAGSWTFVARKDGYASTGKASIALRSSVPPDPVLLYLARGHTLTGRVLDETDAPIAGALVLGGGDGNVWNIGATALRARAVSGADGAYALAALAAGDTAIWAAPAGATPGQVVTLRIPDVATFDIRLRKGGVLTGRVVLQGSDEPVEGAKVRAMTWGTSGSRTAEAVTDAEGRYTIDDLPEGNIGNVTAEKSGLVQVVESANPWQPAPFRGGERVERDVRMATGAVLKGTVTGPSGPVSGARVMVMYQRGTGNFDQKQATTDGEGRYRVDSLAAGRYLLQAAAPGLYTPDFPSNWWMALQGGSLPEHVTGETVAGEESVKDIELKAGTTVSGRVETSAGEPVQGASVRAASGNGWLGAPGEPSISADDGFFRLEGVVPGAQVQLTATKRGLALAPRDPLVVTDDTPVENELLVMQPLPVVRGRVTTSSGDLPEDAYVQVIAIPDFGGRNIRFDATMFAGGAERHPVRRDGSFEATIEWAQGAFNVVASAPGFAAATSERVTLDVGRTEYVVDLTLGDGLSLSGRVVSDVTGEGIADARVRVTSGGVQAAPGMQMVAMGNVVSQGGGGGGAVVVAISDETGAFTARGLAAGEQRVSAGAEGFVEGTVDARTPSTAQVRVALAPELEITGTVAFGSGKAVAGVTVNAASADAPSGAGGMNPLGRGPSGGASGATDAQGRFVLRGLARGQYVLSVRNDWGGSANLQPFTSQPIAAGTSDVVLTVQEGLRIAGRIVDEAGSPVAQCWIWGNPTVATAGRPNSGVNAQAKPDGTFELVGLPTDVESYDLTFNAQAMGGAYTPVSLQKVKPGTTGLEIVMKVGLKIEGTIVDAAGKPLLNAWVVAQPLREEGESGSRGSANGAVGDGGAFVVSGLQPGRYTLTVQSFGSGGNRQLVLEGGQDIAAGTSGLRLTATPGATISGTVVDGSGRPLPNANVSAAPTAGGRGSNAGTDANGAFEVAGLADGATYTVSARAAGSIPAQVENVTAGTSGLRLEVREGVQADGRAVAADGSPLSRVRLYLQPVERQGVASQSARCDEDGRFGASGLEEGVTYKVTARVRRDGQFVSLDLGTVRGGQSGVELRAGD